MSHQKGMGSMTITDLPAAGRAAPTRAREHIRYLQGYGLSGTAIAALCGVSVSLIQHILAKPGQPGYRRFIYAYSERQILAGRFDLDRLPDHVQVNVAGTRRRLQALACLGWSQVEIADMLGVDHTVMSMYVTGRRSRCVVWRARQVRDLYAKLSMKLGSSPQAAGHAKAEGWAPPWAWDDETMDHPDTAPDLECLTPRRRPKPSEHTLEDVAFLLQVDLPTGTIYDMAARLGVTKDAITRAFRRVEDHATREAYGDQHGPLTLEATLALDEELALLYDTRARLKANQRAAEAGWAEAAS